MMRCLLDPSRRDFDVLAFARDLGSVWIIVHHVARAAAAGCIDFLLDGRRHQVLRGCAGLPAGIDVP